MDGTIAALAPEAKRAGWKNPYFGLIGFFRFARCLAFYRRLVTTI